MLIEPSEPRLEKVTGRPIGWRLVSAGLAIAVIVGTLWLKPWDGAPRGAVLPGPTGSGAIPRSPIAGPSTVITPRPSATPGPSATPQPTADAEALALARRRFCQPADSWRLVSIEKSERWRTRTMWGTVLQEASGPNDPTLLARRDYADKLIGVGVCAPASSIFTPVEQLRAVALWHIPPGGRAREIARPTIIDQQLFELGEAYYGPPQGEGNNWPAGRYLFAIRPPDGGSVSWLALEFIPTRARPRAGARL